MREWLINMQIKNHSYAESIFLLEDKLFIFLAFIMGVSLRFQSNISIQKEEYLISLCVQYN